MESSLSEHFALSYSRVCLLIRMQKERVLVGGLLGLNLSSLIVNATRSLCSCDFGIVCYKELIDERFAPERIGRLGRRSARH